MHAASFASHRIAVLLTATLSATLACSTGEADDAGNFSASLGSGPDSKGPEDEDSSESETGESTTTEDEESTSSTSESEESTSEADTTEDETDTGEPIDPCPLICEGMADPTPTTCDAPYIIGRTKAKEGFFFGGSTTNAGGNDTEACGPNTDPANWDSGHDHFFRIFLYTGDEIEVVMNSQFDKRVKVHDEAECIGKAKDCSDGVLSYTALEDDWVTVVADGQSLAFMDWGDYTLNLQLIPSGTDACQCP